MKTLVIGKNDENQRLDKFLQKALPLLPQSLLYRAIRQKKIKRNGKRAQINDRLQEGDQITLYLNDDVFGVSTELPFLSVPSQINIVYEDENILLCDKPVGLCVHEDNDNTPDTLIARCLHYLYDKGEYRPQEELSFTPALCNRIDRNTAGLVIIAKNAESLRLLNEIIKNREVKKTYLCVVSGHPKPEAATLTHYLERKPNESLVRVLDRPTQNSKTIITGYRVLKKTPNCSLLEVALETGRTHQIRAHLAHIGHPLIGDGKYGDNRQNRSYGQTMQLLYACRLTFRLSKSGHLLDYLNGKTFSAPNIWFAERFSELFQ